MNDPEVSRDFHEALEAFRAGIATLSAQVAQQRAPSKPIADYVMPILFSLVAAGLLGWMGLHQAQLTSYAVEITRIARIQDQGSNLAPAIEEVKGRVNFLETSLREQVGMKAQLEAVRMDLQRIERTLDSWITRQGSQGERTLPRGIP